MVAQGLIEDPRPGFVSELAAEMYRDFFRLSERSVAVGMGGLVISVGMPWLAVKDWAVENGHDPELCRDIFYALRDEHQGLENELLAEKAARK